MSSPVEVETSQAGKVDKPKRSWADEGNSSDDESTTPESHNEDKTVDPYAPEPKEQHQQQQQHQHQQQQQQQQQQQRPERGEAQTGRNSFSEIPMTGPFVAYVGNLPYSITARDVGEFFERGDCDVADVIIKMDEQGRGRGFAHVEFKNRDSLLKSFEANGYEIGQRSIKVDYHPVKQKNDRGGRMGGGGDRDRDRNDNNREETEVSWVRAPRREPAPLPPKPESNRPIVRGNAPDRGDRGNDRGATRGGGGGGGVSNRDRPAREQEQQPPAVRPKIILAPRKVNVEGEEQPVARVSDIFGGGKPHDENKYEV
jgi:RNA recognition motif. (a.k.a. RRM, RBD, or RNP domain)